MDGTRIDAENYTAASGSTVITLQADYLNTLSVGTHKLTIVYTDGECSTNFEVKAASGQIILIDPSQPAEPAEPQSNPNTGDNSMMWLCIALLVVSGTCMAASLIHNRKNSMSD